MATLLRAPTVSNGWLLAAQAAAAAPGGRVLHAVVSIEHPGPPEPEIVHLLDDLLQSKHHSVSTVASTVFPSNMYANTGLTWHPDMAESDQRRLDQAAEDLYESYQVALPMLCTADGNRQGTYFGRLVSWPGKTSDGYNQLAVRIRQLRAQRRSGKAISNAADLVLDGPAERAVSAMSEKENVEQSLQVYRSRDERTRAFPCLVHIDISVLDNRLSLLAVYRHWHLITKAMGNLIGLSRLHHFLAQQSGYDVGEMVVHGTVTNAQFNDFGTTRIRALIERAQAVLEAPTETSPLDETNSTVPGAP